MPSSGKTTYIIGASPKPERVAFVAANRLVGAGHAVELLGLRRGAQVAGQTILDLRQRPVLTPPHTLTMYMGAARQKEYEDYLLSLSPQRIVFNPGAENARLAEKAEKQGIEVQNHCTLVMLATGQY